LRGLGDGGTSLGAVTQSAAYTRNVFNADVTLKFRHGSEFSFEGAVEDGGVVLGLLQSGSSVFFVRFCLNDRRREIPDVPENIINAFAGSTPGPAALNDNASVRENGLLSD
jgi:hypothetical protein